MEGREPRTPSSSGPDFYCIAVTSKQIGAQQSPTSLDNQKNREKVWILFVKLLGDSNWESLIGSSGEELQVQVDHTFTV